MIDEYKINLKDAMDILKVKNVNRFCKNCGVLIPLVNMKMGQRVSCPECGATYIIKQEIKINIIIDPVETIEKRCPSCKRTVNVDPTAKYGKCSNSACKHPHFQISHTLSDGKNTDNRHGIRLWSIPNKVEA